MVTIANPEINATEHFAYIQSQGRQIVAYNETLAQRIRSMMPSTDVVEKKMFGGLAFMINGNMCCGIVKDTLMARVVQSNMNLY